MKAFLLPTSTLASSNPSRMDMLWRVVGVVVCAALIAKWVWVFVAPQETALPTTAAWKKSADAEHLFGDVPVAVTTQSSSLGNVQLVGVFAHASKGFAVLSVEGKQVGVGLGELVMPGARLIETHADYVLIERSGVKSRVDLPISKSSGNANTAAVSTSASVATAPNTTNMPPATPDSIAAENSVSPQIRAAMQQELEHFRRHP